MYNRNFCIIHNVGKWFIKQVSSFILKGFPFIFTCCGWGTGGCRTSCVHTILYILIILGTKKGEPISRLSSSFVILLLILNSPRFSHFHTNYISKSSSGDRFNYQISIWIWHYSSPSYEGRLLVSPLLLIISSQDGLHFEHLLDICHSVPVSSLRGSLVH